MLNVIVLIAMLFCALQVVRASQLIHAALWLACVSAMLATLLYQLGAHEVAVIELSVGAGLVTVLFVFAISLAGDEPLPRGRGVPRSLAFALVLIFLLLLIFILLPLTPSNGASSSNASFAEIFWQERSGDALAQIVLIFAGALTVLGLLTEQHRKTKPILTPVEPLEVPQEQPL